MKKTANTFQNIKPIFLLLILTMVVMIASLPFEATGIATASGLEDKVDNEFIAFYENEIAHAPVITNTDKVRADRLKKTYDLTDNKLNLLLVLEDFGVRVGNPKSFDELTKMSDNKLFLYGKTLVDAFGDTLDEDEKAVLKAKFFYLLKRKSSS